MVLAFNFSMIYALIQEILNKIQKMVFALEVIRDKAG